MDITGISLLPYFIYMYSHFHVTKVYDVIGRRITGLFAGVSLLIGNGITPPNRKNVEGYSRPSPKSPPFHPTNFLASTESLQSFLDIRISNCEFICCNIIAMSLSNKLSITDVDVKGKKVLIRVR